MKLKALLAAAVVLGAAIAGLVAGAVLPGTRLARARPARALSVRRSSSPSPCGTLALGSTSYSHVVWIWMENHSYGEVIGSSEAPYLNALARECGLASNYHNISHPSLPNYIAATSGLALAQLGRFASDCRPSHRCTTTAASIFAQASSWRAYEESMPKRCDRRNRRRYAVRHNPPPYYTALAGCAAGDVPFTALATDLAQGKLPAFSFVTPNLIDDMHDGTVAQGDAWLQANLPALLGSTAYQGGHVVVFVTWDEGAGGSTDECATNVGDAGCHVATLVLSPSTPKDSTSAALFNHYSLLRTSEQLLGLPPLGEAAAASSMLAAFDL